MCVACDVLVSARIIEKRFRRTSRSHCHLQASHCRYHCHTRVHVFSESIPKKSRSACARFCVPLLSFSSRVVSCACIFILRSRCDRPLFFPRIDNSLNCPQFTRRSRFARLLFQIFRSHFLTIANNKIYLYKCLYLYKYKHVSRTLYLLNDDF